MVYQKEVIFEGNYAEDFLLENIELEKVDILGNTVVSEGRDGSKIFLVWSIDISDIGSVEGVNCVRLQKQV